MKFSERWLRTMVNPQLDTQGLCDRLTMAGLEVEEAVPAAPPFSGVVVAKIEAVAPHPNADRLRVCTVDVGKEAPLQIVCGAPNAAAGMKVPCATIGAVLPGNFTIKAAKMRGVESAGMLCSARELGISEDASGLLALPDDAIVGSNVRDALALDDTLITLKLTPNRADCLSIQGIAREVAAITGAPLTPPPATPVPVATDTVRPIIVASSEGCPRFCARTIEGIDPTAPTPAWMKERIERSGIRSISAVVDITNYVMLELGQPLHAYDDRLLEGDVVVRFAEAGETLTLLNGQVLELERDMLMVCDEKKPLGLAGIMGGEHSGINDSTTTVFLEGAYWDPAVIQGKSRRLGFASDAGHRFERGVDFNGCAAGVDRAAQLILDICGGRAGPLQDVCAKLPLRPAVRVRPSRIARLLGINLPVANIAAIFERLGLACVRDGDDFLLTPPSYRFDLAIEEDFVEEIARIHGYDEIPAVPAAHVQRMLPDSEYAMTTTALKRRLAAREWHEVITFSFVDSAWESAFFPDRAESAKPVAVLNPIAAQLDVMRTTLLGGMVETLKTNLSRKQDRVRVFEVGRCFDRANGGYNQPLRLGGLAYGDALAEQWGTARRAVDLFDVKGDLEAIVAPRTLTTERAEHPALHPGRSARVLVDDKPVGWLGELHPRLVRQFDLARAPVVFELELPALLARPLPAARPVPKVPVVRRDIALVIDESVPAQAVLTALHTGRPARVDTIELFDVYRGAGLATGKKSLAILVLMQDTDRTLTDPEIDAIVAELVRIVVDTFGATLRQ